jgi:heptaprenyl diphosphate synthase
MSLRELYNSHSTNVLFIAGLLMMPSILFNPSTEIRIFQFLFFTSLVILSGKKINVVMTLIVIIGIIAFNLVLPYGKVLFTIGRFEITEGALRAGIHRAVTFEALIMLSKASIREDLKLPGAFGELLGESLRLFSVMTSGKYKVTSIHFFSRLDKMLMELSDRYALPPFVFTRDHTVTAAAYFILANIILVPWIPFGMLLLLQ